MSNIRRGNCHQRQERRTVGHKNLIHLVFPLPCSRSAPGTWRAETAQCWWKTWTPSPHLKNQSGANIYFMGLQSGEGRASHVLTQQEDALFQLWECLLIPAFQPVSFRQDQRAPSPPSFTRSFPVIWTPLKKVGRLHLTLAFLRRLWTPASFLSPRAWSNVLECAQLTAINPHLRALCTLFFG